MSHMSGISSVSDTIALHRARRPNRAGSYDSVFSAIHGRIPDTSVPPPRRGGIARPAGAAVNTSCDAARLEDFVMDTTTPAARFSDDELLQIKGLAYDLIDIGQWSHLERQISEDYDRVLVLMPIGRMAHYRIERDQTGWTYLLWCSPDTWQLLVCGTFDECLKLLSVTSK
jgi:hypothetical protein